MTKNIGIGIDLGTANLLVYVEKKGIVFNEPSVIAFDRETGQIIAAGQDAHDMIGKSHEKIAVIKPLRDGVVSDMRAAKALLTYVFNSLDFVGEKDFTKVTTLICCPSEVTKIERDVMIDLAVSMGMGDTFIEEEVKSAAIGSGIDIFKTKGILLVDIGGGTTDVGVLSFGDIVLSRTVRMAGNYIDELIMKHVKKTHKLEIGEQTAEKIKMGLGSLVEGEPAKELKFAGRDIVVGFPRWVTLNSDEIKEVITPVYEEVAKLIAAVLKDTPPELSADIYRDGIILAGGGSMIPGLTDFIHKRIKVPIKVVNNPLTCVVEGTKYLLRNRGNYLINPMDR